jgi:ribokinase
MNARLGVIGSNMIDLIAYVTRVPERGETLTAQSFASGFGGKGANQAIAAAKLGSSVVMVSKVGEDDFARGTLDNFRRYGVLVDHVTVAPGTTSGVAPIMVEPSGENRILIAGGANDHLAPADIDAAIDALRDCALVLLQLEVPLETVYHAVGVCRKLNVPVLLNPAPARELDFTRLADLDYLVLNESELTLLSGEEVTDLARIEPATRALRAKGIKRVIVTLGARGAMLIDAGGSRLIPPKVVEAVDTSGAGDAFIGSFAHALIAGLAVEDALELATRYAAYSVTRRGTQASYPDAAEFHSSP